MFKVHILPLAHSPHISDLSILDDVRDDLLSRNARRRSLHQQHNLAAAD
jgi:hypothetical protein